MVMCVYVDGDASVDGDGRVDVECVFVLQRLHTSPEAFPETGNLRATLKQQCAAAAGRASGAPKRLPRNMQHLLQMEMMRSSSGASGARTEMPAQR